MAPRDKAIIRLTIESLREHPKLTISVSTLARWCDISRTTAYRWMDDHGLPFVQVGGDGEGRGGNRLIRVEVLYDWLKSFEGRAS